jgi:molecular chaperone GrpE
MTKRKNETLEEPAVPRPGEESLEASAEKAGVHESGEPTEGSEGGGETVVGTGRETESEPPPEVDVPEASELEILQSEIDQLKDKHLRLAADFENYRKRANAEAAGVWIRARADLVRALVEGLDDLQRVSQFTSEDTTVEALIEGVDLVERNLLKGLSEAGLVVLNPVGERFDPNTMEAMMRVEAEEEGQDDTVHQVFQKGYMFKDQLVRPARVSVYKDDD